MVSGPANALPREWARAWQVCRAGDLERMDEVREVLAAFRLATRAAGSQCTIACLKRALATQGVISSAAVAAGTPDLDAERADRFDAAFLRVLEQARERIGAPWVSAAPVGAGSGRA